MDTGMSAIGILGFIFGIIALARIRKLEKQLKETGVLEQEFDSGK